MKNYLTFNYFHIKVINDEYDYVYIDIYPHYTIKDVKDIINKKQGNFNNFHLYFILFLLFINHKKIFQK